MIRIKIYLIRHDDVVYPNSMSFPTKRKNLISRLLPVHSLPCSRAILCESLAFFTFYIRSSAFCEANRRFDRSIFVARRVYYAAMRARVWTETKRWIRLMSCGQASRWGCPDVDRFENGRRKEGRKRGSNRDRMREWGATGWAVYRRGDCKAVTTELGTGAIGNRLQLSPPASTISPYLHFLLSRCAAIRIYLVPSSVSVSFSFSLSAPLFYFLTRCSLSHVHVYASWHCRLLHHLLPRRARTILLTSRAQNTWQPHCQSY